MKTMVHLLFLVAGIVAITAALLNWEWFFTSKNALFVRSRNQARIFYGIVGLLLIVLAVILFIKNP